MTVIPRQAFTDAEKAILRQELRGAEYAGKTPEEIARMLTIRSLIPNPKPQPQLPKPLDKAVLFQQLQSALVNFSDQALIRLSEAVDANDHATVKLWADLALARGWVTQADYDLVVAELQKTVPDPDWESHIPGPTRMFELIGRDRGISVAEVEELMA